MKIRIIGEGVTTSRSDQTESKKSNSQVSYELAKKITKGDNSASNHFVQINYQWLMFIIRRKFSKSNNHEDIVQDTFMLVINKLQQGKINQPKAILGFLRTTAIHIGYEYLRKDKKFISAIDQDLLDVIEDAKEDILSTIIWNDKVKYVKQVLSELKIQRDKDILIKFYFQDQSKPSICLQLELSSEHFDRVLYRAKERLKQLIKKKGDNSPNNKTQPLKNKDSKDQQKPKSYLMLKIASIISGSVFQPRNSELCKGLTTKLPLSIVILVNAGIQYLKLNSLGTTIKDLFLGLNNNKNPLGAKS